MHSVWNACAGLNIRAVWRDCCFEPSVCAPHASCVEYAESSQHSRESKVKIAIEERSNITLAAVPHRQ